MRSKHFIGFVNSFIFLSSLLLSFSAFSQSNNSKTLAECEFVYSYAAQTMQINNNLGAAVNLIKRSSIMTSANMMANSDSNVIKASTLRLWSDYREALKLKLQADSNILMGEISKCDTIAIPIALKVREGAKVIWGKTFDELQHEIFIQHKTSLGL